jgi:hypothetical protein
MSPVFVFLRLKTIPRVLGRTPDALSMEANHFCPTKPDLDLEGDKRSRRATSTLGVESMEGVQDVGPAS